jgi:hypothetical protein
VRAVLEQHQAQRVLEQQALDSALQLQGALVPPDLRVVIQAAVFSAQAEQMAVVVATLRTVRQEPQTTVVQEEQGRLVQSLVLRSCTGTVAVVVARTVSVHLARTILPTLALAARQAVMGTEVMGRAEL